MSLAAVSFSLSLKESLSILFNSFYNIHNRVPVFDANAYSKDENERVVGVEMSGQNHRFVILRSSVNNEILKELVDIRYYS